MALMPETRDCWRVLVVELDGGPVLLSDRHGTLGIDTPIAAVLSWGSASAAGAELSIERQALPAHVQAAWWVNRPAELRECLASDGGVVAGRLVFSGIVAAQPSESAGVWSLRLAPPRRRVRPVPDLGIVTATDWPLASDAAMGAVLPEIFGTVERCPLLPVETRAATTLAQTAEPGAVQFVVEDATALADSGSVWVDGTSYTYASRADDTLYGISPAVSVRHQQGTLVAQSGNWTYLAAGHAVDAISDLRGDDALLDGATTDLAAATVQFSSPPARVTRSERYNVQMHFDTVDTGTTASNPVNAIRAIISTYSNIAASSLPGAVTAASSNAVIQWARPADGNRIIGGVYSVSYTVSVAVQSGRVEASIGGQVVWVWEAGTGTIYNPGSVTLEQNEDVDQIPVVLSASGAGDAAITVTVARRSVVTGNRDEANYSTLAPGQVLNVSQTDVPPEYGRIREAWLVVRWFASTAGLGTTAVTLGGRALGPLKQTQLSASTLSQTISASVSAQGSATLPAQSITASISGGTGTLSNTVSVMRETITPAYQAIGGADSTKTYYGLAMMRIKPPQNVIAGSHTVRIMSSKSTSPTSILDGSDLNLPVRIWDSAAAVSAVFHPASSASRSVTMSADEAEYTTSIVTTAGQTGEITIAHELQIVLAAINNLKLEAISQFRKALYVSIDWNISAISRNDTPASGSVSNPFSSSQSLSNTGVSVSTSNGSISFTVPAPPRVVDTWFSLPYREWGDFAAKQLSITLTGGSANLAVVEASLFADYDAETWALPESLTATVTGRDGNPAAVIARLAAASGQPIAGEASRRLSAWATANGLTLARRIAERQDALTLLTWAAEQSGVMLAETDDGLAPVRWLDRSGAPLLLEETDLLEPAEIGWADRVETDITLRYREDASAGGMTRALRASAADTRACERGEAELGDSRPVEIDGGWLRDDTAAAVALAAHVGRFARPRRTLSLTCPFGVGLQEGQLLEYRPLGASAAGGITARVLRRTEQDGWPVIEAEEVLR